MTVCRSVLAMAVVCVMAGCQMPHQPTAPTGLETSRGPGTFLAQGPTNGPLAGLRVSKVNMCHRTDTGAFHLINISGNAEATHIGHGDARPGDPVPGSAGMRFDEACQQMPAVSGPPLQCPCYQAYSEAQLVSVLNAPAVQFKVCNSLDDMVFAAASDGTGWTMLAANAATNSCTLAVNGTDTRLGPLTPEEGAQCLLEAKRMYPQISWCS